MYHTKFEFWNSQILIVNIINIELETIKNNKPRFNLIFFSHIEHNMFYSNIEKLS